MSTIIGEKLARARRDRSLSLEEAATSTHMRLRYLQALEAGDFTSLPSKAQARGFLRSYASYLGLDASRLLAELDRSLQPSPPDPETESQPAALSPSGDDAGLTGFANSPAEEIFKDLGQRLQRQRELLGLSLADVERHTHVRNFYLEALECGDLSRLPSSVQGRGMLKNYAVFLGMDPDPLLLRFAEGLQALLAARQAASAPSRPRAHPQLDRKPSPLRRLVSSELLLAGVIVVSLVVFIVWAAVRVIELRSGEVVVSTAPSVAEVLMTPGESAGTSSTPGPGETESASGAPGEETTAAVTSAPDTSGSEDEAGTEPETTADLSAETQAVSQAGQETLVGGVAGANTVPTGTLNAPEVPATAVQVYVTVRQRAWMRVTVDGEVEFEGRVLAGSAYQYSADSQVEVLTGNGAALQIFFNSQDLGPLGQFGQVVQRVFTPDGVQTPTPTVTPTGSPTPRGATPQATSQATSTLQPFVTPTLNP